jgi:hypothetical protein
MEQVMTRSFRFATPTHPEYSRIALVAAYALFLLIGQGGDACAQQQFKTPDEAVAALVAATRSGNAREMMSVLGREGRDILFSGDEVADRNARNAFLVAYDLKHQIQKQGENTAQLVVGTSDWRLPIPLVQRDGAWQFDTARGREEILYRRIGRNELNALQVMLAYIDAQNEYADMNPSGGRVASYAQRILSTPGTRDGLYWPASANEPRSPLGAAMALATLQGYRPGQDGPTPYHGYYYKILTAQGPTAPGGALNYVINGKMVGGFALVAWPAAYGNSGVMTFLVNHDGTIFQKDLGERTDRIASRMTAFGPDHTWKEVEAADLATR